jgi:hypothetical protein
MNFVFLSEGIPKIAVTYLTGTMWLGSVLGANFAFTKLQSPRFL